MISLFKSFKYTAISTLLGLMLVSTTSADVLEDAIKEGVLTVGVSLFEPWTIKNKEGELSGFEIDVARKLAEDMKLKLEVKVYPWKDIISAVNKGEVDLIAGGMAITPERALQVEFSQPYSEDGVAIATNTSLTKDFKSFSELNKKSINIATVTDTLGANIATLVFKHANITYYDEVKAAEKAILSGKAHAYVASLPETRFIALEHPKKIDLPLAKPLIESKAGFAVKPGEQRLLNYLNAWITARQADKWLTTTNKYWFESIAWRQEGH